MAHEIGHALLGPNAHAANGIMRGEVQVRDMKALLYSCQECGYIRS